MVGKEFCSVCGARGVRKASETPSLISNVPCAMRMVYKYVLSAHSDNHHFTLIIYYYNAMTSSLELYKKYRKAVIYNVRDTSH